MPRTCGVYGGETQHAIYGCGYAVRWPSLRVPLAVATLVGGSHCVLVMDRTSQPCHAALGRADGAIMALRTSVASAAKCLTQRLLTLWNSRTHANYMGIG